jgi:hypothetical protein
MTTGNGNKRPSLFKRTAAFARPLCPLLAFTGSFNRKIMSRVKCNNIKFALGVMDDVYRYAEHTSLLTCVVTRIVFVIKVLWNRSNVHEGVRHFAPKLRELRYFE